MEIFLSMNSKQKQLQSALAQRNAVKVIAGINNFDAVNVISVAKAAEAAGAHVLDIAADAGLMAAARNVSSMALMVSATDVETLLEAATNGADALELGNFDALYEAGVYLSAEDVLARSQALMAALPQANRPLVSITVPGHLTLASQIQLAQALEKLGVDMIQSEGATRVVSASPSAQTPATAEEKAEIALRNTRAIAAAVSTPVIAASGITAMNSAKAFEVGASAVGIGSFINKAFSEAEMTERAHSVMANRSSLLRQAV